jgi:predicted CXXCH cytochrome family protein
MHPASAEEITPVKETAVSAEAVKIIVLEPGASCISASCHAEIDQKEYLHTIGVDGMKCDRCHKTINEKEHIFNKIPDVTMPLCAQCHSDKQLPPKGLKKQPPRVISLDDATILHTPFADGKCTQCHNPHSSNNYKHLKLPYPEGIYASYSAEAYGLCLSCHKDLDKVMTEPRTVSLTMFRNGNANLHFRHVNKRKGRTCKTCHQHHGWNKPGLMLDTFKFGNRMLTVDYEKTESGGKCSTTCHRISKYDRYKPEFNFIKTAPFPGENATKDELEMSRKDDMNRKHEKEASEQKK